MMRPLAFLLLCLAAPACMAQTAIRHCLSADGTPVFTDQPCDSVASMKLGAIIPHMRGTCPTTRKNLRQRVAAAFGDHDANALAGLMLWDGYRDSAALDEVARLQRAMQRPLMGVVDSTGPPPAPPASTLPPLVPAAGSAMPPPDLGALIVHLGGVQPGADASLRFAVEARAGCLWLRP